MVKLNNMTARDGQQSILGGRVQQKDLLAALHEAKQAPYNMYEVWGGTAFDMPLKYKGENPFQNLREFREEMGEDANLSMLLRGRNITGYTTHDDSIVEAFIREAAQPFGLGDKRMGINTFRIFDSLNDLENMRPAIKAVKKLHDEEGLDVRAQGTLSYTVIDEEQRKDVIAKGGRADLFEPSYYVELAEGLVEAGADSICIKDMAGVLDAEHAGPLVEALKAALPNTPIVLHSQSGLGLSDEAIIAAIKAGVDEVDTCSEGLSDGSGHSATETILDSLERRHPELYPEEFKTQEAQDALKTEAKKWRAIRPKYAERENPFREDLQELVQTSKVPGGMTTTLRGQIKEAGYPKEIEETLLAASLKEMANVRAEACYITLVTPSSQIVGTQAVSNVLKTFIGLGANASISADDIANSIKAKRDAQELYSQDYWVTAPFARLMFEGIGKLPYTPDETILKQIEQQHPAVIDDIKEQKRLPTFQEERAKLQESVRTFIAQNEPILESADAKYLSELRDNPSAQNVLMFAIKPAKPLALEEKNQNRLMSIIHNNSPALAEKLEHNIDAIATLDERMEGLSEESRDTVEQYAQAQIRAVRLQKDAIVLPPEEKAYQIERANDVMRSTKEQMGADEKAAAFNRLRAFGIGEYGHLIDRGPRDPDKKLQPQTSWKDALVAANEGAKHAGAEMWAK